ncbi:hypothetical protein [Methanolobus sp. ZRKC5]
MRVLSCIVCIAMILLLSGVTAASSIATVHGVAYEWSTFEPLDNAIIEVNSTPSQSMVAKYGVYSFELPNGSYHITASYYEDDQLTYSAEDTIVVSDEGSYVLDLLLLPSYSSTGEETVSSAETTLRNNSILIGAIFVVVILMFILVVQIKRKPQKSLPSKKVKIEEFLHVSPVLIETATDKSVEEEQEVVPEEDTSTTASETIDEVVNIPLAESKKEPFPIHSDEPVPADLQEILDILKSQGGRMTQKDMRKRLKYSEGKVSLMLLDLEKRGKIQKFKKGRGNVLFLVESEE